MARKSSNLDEKMLRVGANVLKKKGAAKLSIRDVTQKAGANLGMFNYHFGSKEKFILQVLEQVYSEFIVDLEKSKVSSSGLEAVLFRMAVFSRDNKTLILALMGDVLSGETIVTKFLKNHFITHFSILHEALMTHCQTNGFPTRNLEHAFRFLIGAVGLPNLLLELSGKLNSEQPVTEDSDAALKLRTRAAISGLNVLLIN